MPLKITFVITHEHGENGTLSINTEKPPGLLRTCSHEVLIAEAICMLIEANHDSFAKLLDISQEELQKAMSDLEDEGRVVRPSTSKNIH